MVMRRGMHWYLGAFPDVLGVFGILFDNWQDTGSNNAMGSTEVVVDLFEEGVSMANWKNGQFAKAIPWRVSVMDCSSFSSSSVNVRLRCAATLGRDMAAISPAGDQVTIESLNHYLYIVLARHRILHQVASHAPEVIA